MTHYNNTHTTLEHSDITDATGQQSILRQIHKGMPVYDVRDNRIGSVAFVHFGAASETQQQLGVGPAAPAPADNPNVRPDTLIDNVAETFDPNEVPQELQEKLLVSGYVRLDTAGFFATDRFITRAIFTTGVLALECARISRLSSFDQRRREIVLAARFFFFAIISFLVLSWMCFVHIVAR